ncbi:MAG: dynamin family protein [Thermoanaerobaculia bacterium]
MPVPESLSRHASAVDVSALEALEGAANEAGVPALAEEARAFASRVAEGLFYVVCVGEFKRGKSTLLNALVGREIFPVGVVPVTSAVTILRHGPAPEARVTLSGGEARRIALADIRDYVTEDRNPENRRGVVAVEAFLPSPLLAAGMCLVDTPGIGSVFAGNTAATRDFLPHIDAALVVLGADPPVSGDELALVAEVARGIEHLVFVLNKADRLPEDECAEAARFAERVLALRLKRPVSLLSVSATEQLRSQGPPRDWDALVRSLETLAHEAGADLVRSAAERASRRISHRLLHEIEEQRSALLRPFEESERRLGDLEASLADAERAILDLGYLLLGEENRIAARLDADRDVFLARTLPEAGDELRHALDAHADLPKPRGSAAETARRIALKALASWAEAERPEAERLYRDGADRFVEMGNAFLARFLGADEPGLEDPMAGLARETGFRGRSRFHFTSLLAIAEPAPLARLLDPFRTRKSVRAAVARDANAYLERLLSSNSARVKNDLIDLVRESRRRLEAEIRERLSAAVRSASAALDRAKARRAEGEASVRTELARLESLRRSVEAAGGAA